MIRGGLFSSGWLRIMAWGMVSFTANGGDTCWVSSPILSEADWEAVQTGDAARTGHCSFKAFSLEIKSAAGAGTESPRRCAGFEYPLHPPNLQWCGPV